MNAGRMRGFLDRNTGWVLVAAVAAGFGLWAGRAWFDRPHAAPAAIAAVPALQATSLFPAPRALPEFSLQGEAAPLASRDLRGHWTVVFLGFTHCPDVCPTTLSQLAQAQDAWRALPDASRPQVLFVSVDPARDTPAKLAQYARHFHADTRVATAAEPELQSFVQALGMVYMKVPQPGGDYMMDHSATLVVLDPQGRQAGLIRPPFDPGAIAADLAALAQAAP